MTSARHPLASRCYVTEYVAGSTSPYTLPWWAEAKKRYGGRQLNNTLTRFRAEAMRPKLSKRAKSLGHEMGEWVPERGEKDRVESWVAQCDRCGLWMGVTAPDPEDEPDGTYGSCLVVECEGRGTRAHWARKE